MSFEKHVVDREGVLSTPPDEPTGQTGLEWYAPFRPRRVLPRAVRSAPVRYSPPFMS